MFVGDRVRVHNTLKVIPIAIQFIIVLSGDLHSVFNSKVSVRARCPQGGCISLVVPILSLFGYE